MYSTLLFLTVFVKLGSPFYTAAKCCPHGQELMPTHYECYNTSTLATHIFDSTIAEVNIVLYRNETRFPQCLPYEAFVSRTLTSFKERKHLFREFSDLCVDISDRTVVLVGCIGQNSLEILPHRKGTLKKCCPMGKNPVPKPRDCDESSDAFKPIIYDISDLMTPLLSFSTDYDIISPGCSDKALYSEPTYLLKNGSVYFPNSSQEIYNQEESCVDTLFGEHNIFICFGDEIDDIEDTHSVHFISGIGLVISLSFLAATFILYAWDKKKRHFYGQTVMCHVASFFIAFLCLARLKFASTEGVTCEATAYILYASFIAGFLWQNVMCIDLWRTFRSIRSRDVLGSRRKELRFIGYSIYAWGCTVMLTAMVITGSKLSWLPECLAPKIKDCWLERKHYSYFLFFIGPIACVIASNTILYILTARRCCQVKAEIAKRLNKLDAKQNNAFFRNKEQLSLSAKLFVVMGVNWSFEVISFMLKSHVPRWIFYISDALNALYGLQIFVIFVLRKKMVVTATRAFTSSFSSIRGFRKNPQGACPPCTETSVLHTDLDETTM